MALTRDKCARGKDGVTDKETRGTDHVTRLGLKLGGLLLGMSVRGDSCLVSDGMRLVLRERRDKAGTEEILKRIVQKIERTVSLVYYSDYCRRHRTQGTDSLESRNRFPYSKGGSA